MAAWGRADVETRDPSDIDRIVSERILARRNELDMSQPELAERVGVTFQQVQKYERGTSTLSVARLFEFTQIYEIDPATIFGNRPFKPDRMPAEGMTHRARSQPVYWNRIPDSSPRDSPRNPGSARSGQCTEANAESPPLAITTGRAFRSAFRMSNVTIAASGGAASSNSHA